MAGLGGQWPVADHGVETDKRQTRETDFIYVSFDYH